MAADHVRLRNGLLIHGGHTGIWAALAKGFYEEEDIDCAITRGYGSAKTVREVAAGEVEIGEVDLAVMLMGRSEGLPLKGVGVLYHRAQHVVYTLGQSGISSPGDLHGRSIAVTESDAGSLLFPAFLNHAGLDAEDVNRVFIPAEEKVPTLLSGEVDALLSYVINGPAIEAGAAEKGWTARGLLWADFGFDMVSNGFVVSESLLDERPDVVRRFLRATYRGVSWALSNPVEAADLFSERNPHISQDLARLQWKRTIPFIVTDDSRRDGLGFLPTGKLEETLRVLRPLGRGGAESAEAVYSNDFLPDKALQLPPQSAGALSEISWESGQAWSSD